MHDPRFDKLAKVLVEYSTRLKRNETVLIENFDVPDEMTIALVRAARKAGALPFVQLQRAHVNRELALDATERQLNLTAIHELAPLRAGIRGFRRRFGAAFAASRSERVLAPSEAVGEALTRYLRVTADRVAIVRPGLEPGYSRTTREAAEAARTVFGLPQRYLLSFGDAGPAERAWAGATTPSEGAGLVMAERLRPDVWVKGGDYASDELTEVPVVRRHGGEVVLLPYLARHSTTALVAAARGRVAS